MALPQLNATQLNDLVQTTLRDLGKPKFTEIATDTQDHIVMKNLVRKNRAVLSSGYGVQWDVMINHAQSFANVGLGQSDVVNQIDTMVQATADWRFSTANYSFFAQEIDMNREPARIVNLIQERRIAALIAVAEGMESNFWGPPVAVSDTVTPWGVNTWIVKNATEGFNGGCPRASRPLVSIRQPTRAGTTGPTSIRAFPATT